MKYRNKMATTLSNEMARHLLDLVEQFKDKNPKIAARAKELLDKMKGNNEEEDR